jgi:hypothetical protein
MHSQTSILEFFRLSVYSYLYYLIIDSLATHSLPSSVYNQNHSYLLLFYSISILFSIVIHSYFMPLFEAKSYLYKPIFRAARDALISSILPLGTALINRLVYSF